MQARVLVSDPTDQLLLTFDYQVVNHSGKIAVVYKEHKLTYGELNRKINQTAHFLINYYPKKFTGEEHPLVGIIGDNKLSMLILQFAVLKLGGTYVPLDHDSPGERIKYTLQNANLSLIVSPDVSQIKPHALEAINHGKVELIDCKERQDEINKQEETNTYLSVNDHSPAYILYTSGSTAKEPKGVIQTRRGVWGQIKNYGRDLSITDNDVLLQLAVFTHDQAIVDYYGALLNGSTLCLYDIAHLDAFALRHFMKTNRVTIFSSIPSVFSIIFEGIQDKNTLSDLRVVTIGGEETKLSHVELYQKTCPDKCVLINGYGATECSWELSYTIDHQTDISQLKSIPLGIPTEGLDIYLDNSTTEEGEQAELCINSDYVSSGYLHNETATEKAFTKLGGKMFYRTGDLVKKGLDGIYTFEGRSHWHEKIHGKRVNLHEIESTLQKVVRSDECAIMTAGEGVNKKIYAFVAVKDHLLKEEIIDQMQLVLPSHMIPFDISFMENLPRLPNEKLNRQALKKKLAQRSELQQPVDISELVKNLNLTEFIQHVWCETFGLPVGEVSDNFGALGGDSISAALIINKIKNYFEMKFGLVIDLAYKDFTPNTSLYTLTEHVLDLYQIKESSIYNSTLPQAENFPVVNNHYAVHGVLYYNEDYVGTVFNYEGLCVLANYYNKLFNITIIPPSSFAETINIISTKLSLSIGPAQIGLALLETDNKNAHPMPCVLAIDSDGNAILFIADSLGTIPLDHPVIKELREKFPKLKIAFDLSRRQDDEKSCYTDFIHYLCEALQVDMLSSVRIIEERGWCLTFISPPETFKNTQRRLPDKLDQDKQLNNDEKKRTLRKFLQESTEGCRHFPKRLCKDLPEPAKQKVVKIIPINTHMYKVGTIYKNIIDQHTKELESNYLPLQYKNERGKTITLLIDKSQLCYDPNSFFTQVIPLKSLFNQIEKLSNLPPGSLIGLKCQGEELTSLQQLFNVVTKTGSSLVHPLAIEIIKEISVQEKPTEVQRFTRIMNARSR